MTTTETAAYWAWIFSSPDETVVAEPVESIEDDWHRSGDE